MRDPLATRIREDVERLCAHPDRNPGTRGNRSATKYLAERMRSIGLETEVLTFEVPEWRFGRARIAAQDLVIDAHPGPYSPAVEDEGPLVVIRMPEDIGAADTPGAVLLLCDEIARTQFTPRGYPFYSDPDHAAILEALEAAHPSAVLAATDKSPMTGALSPFPLIEEVGFGVPSAYMTVEQGDHLAKRVGNTVSVSIDSEVRPSSGEQPVGRLVGISGERMVVCAHMDSKPETRGALDNAAGVAVLLAAAELLGADMPGHTLDFVPFNGEDHVLAPGELAWLSVNDDLADISLAINIDAAGLLGGPSAYSLYGVDAATAATIEHLASGFADVGEGPQWPASDHMIFAMSGVPAIALTSMDLEAASREYTHTSSDRPSILDYDVLAGTARFIAAVVAHC